MKYDLSIVNSSDHTAQAIIFLVDPNQAFHQYSLVWNSAMLRPGSNGKFSWQEDYGFVWGPMPELRPGAIFLAAQSVSADTSNRNQTSLSNGPQGLQLSAPVKGPRPGSLSIRSEASVPMNRVAEGITVSGRPAFIVAAQPNMQAVFDLRPQYWIAFGEFQQGEVLEPDMNESAQSKMIYGPPTEVIFPAGITAMKATLDHSDRWIIARG